MATIIATTDFSETAENAVQYAAAAAKHFNAALVLFNSFSLPVHVSNTLFPVSTIQQLIVDNDFRLLELARDLSKRYDIDVVHESRLSFVEDEIVSLVEKYEASLLVIGMAAKSLEQDLWGNTTTAAIKKMKFPVLAIPMGARFEGTSHILFACDVPHELPDKISSGIKQLTTSLGAEIEFFYVDQKVKELKNRSVPVESKYEEDVDGITYHYKHIRSKLVLEEIEKEIINFNANMLIMIPKKHGFWDSLVHRSKTRIMASGLKIPLLSIPL
jgi:nucleotide-binding universal stress UspA family protein